MPPLTPISPKYTREDLIAMIHNRDALVSDLKAEVNRLRYAINAISDDVKLRAAPVTNGDNQ